MLARVRFLSVRFVAGATSTQACHAVGTPLQASGCTSLGANTQGLLFDRERATYAIARDFGGGGLPSIEASANAGLDGRYCVDLVW